MLIGLLGAVLIDSTAVCQALSPRRYVEELAVPLPKRVVLTTPEIILEVSIADVVNML